jgi:hypothetical protein
MNEHSATAALHCTALHYTEQEEATGECSKLHMRAFAVYAAHHIFF